MFIGDLQQKRFNRDDIDLWIADTSNVSKGFICCIQTDDLNVFSQRITEFEKYGCSNNEIHTIFHFWSTI
jgi:hypothetical protein